MIWTGGCSSCSTGRPTSWGEIADRAPLVVRRGGGGAARAPLVGRRGGEVVDRAPLVVRQGGVELQAVSCQTTGGKVADRVPLVSQWRRGEVADRVPPDGEQGIGRDLLVSRRCRVTDGDSKGRQMRWGRGYSP